MNNTFKSVWSFLLLLTFILFIGCTKDDNTLEKPSSDSNIKENIEQISLEELPDEFTSKILSFLKTKTTQQLSGAKSLQTYLSPEATKHTSSNGIITYSIPIKNEANAKSLFVNTSKTGGNNCNNSSHDVLVANTDPSGSFSDLTHATFTPAYVGATPGISVSNNPNTAINNTLYTTLTNLNTNTTTTVSTPINNNNSNNSGTLGNTIGRNRNGVFGGIWSGIKSVTNGVGRLIGRLFNGRKCKCSKSSKSGGSNSNARQESCCSAGSSKSNNNDSTLTGSDNLAYEFDFNIPLPDSLFEEHTTSKSGDETPDCNCALNDIDLYSSSTDTQIKKDAFDCACKSDSTFKMAPFLDLGFVETAWLAEEAQTEVRKMLCKLVKEDGYSSEAKKASQATIKVLMANKLSGVYDQNYYTLINPYFDADTIDPSFSIRFSIECAILKVQHPDWSNTRVFWEASKEMIHLGLDVLGLIPVAGEAADLVNGGIYLVEGDNVNASLSFAGTIPFAGWAATGSKLAVKVVTTAGGEKVIKVIAKGADEVAELATKLSHFTKQIDNAINSIKNGAKYVLEGTGTYRQVAGHHPLAKKAFEGIDTYSFRDAFSVSNNKLRDYDVAHSTITGKQNSLYSNWKRTNPNKEMTINDMSKIELEAMVQSGVPEDVAKGWVIKALEDLKNQGVSEIKNIPWNGVNPN
ncbi:hypothetical protein [Aquimarina longa]|uniref:hypothetical protein n=1 Tax=Aquimarina longa TaxID=1080221 RepID=UPI000783B490|nr:hypothetical protein [Aquimarina longa]